MSRKFPCGRVVIRETDKGGWWHLENYCEEDQKPPVPLSEIPTEKWGYKVLLIDSKGRPSGQMMVLSEKMMRHLARLAEEPDQD